MPYFVVIRERGDARDWSRPMRRQDRFGEHAAVRSRLGSDPWGEGMLRLASVEPWTVLLGGFGAAR